MLSNKPQFSLRSLFLLVTFVALIFGVGKLLGLTIALLIVIGLIIIYAGIKRGWSCLFTSDNGIVWWGALLAFFSIFFTFSYGPMGGAITFGGLSRNADLSWIGFSNAIIVFPFLIAPLIGLGAIAMLIGRSSLMVSRCCLGILITTILVVTLTEISVIVNFHGFIPEKNSLRLHYATSIIVLLISSLVVFVRGGIPKIPLLQILLSVWTLCHLLPIFYPVNLSDTLFSFGAAYWMLLTGTIIISGGSVLRLCKR